MTEAVPQVPRDVARWIREGEVVVWCDRPRPRLLGWPPRSPRGMLAWTVTASLVVIAACVGSLAWAEASGLGKESSYWMSTCVGVALAVLAFPLAMMLLVASGIEFFFPVRERYALGRDAVGHLFGYTTMEGTALRFAIQGPPEVPPGVERGNVEWGEVEVEVLAPTPARLHMVVRWTDVAYPHVIVEQALSGAG